MKLSEIKSNPNNPRVIKDHKFEKLKKSISEFPKMMELRPMVINEDNIVLGGNMRLKALKDLGYKEVPEEWVKRASDLTEEETRRFIIADNVGFGEHDWEMLANEWDTEELEDWGLDIPNINLADEEYTTKIESPIYETKEVKPLEIDLYNLQNYNKLIEDIDKSDITENEKKFLYLAAGRHIEFRYSKIADYYAHSNEAVQSLMEDSALIIIDYKKAIDRGFVKLYETLETLADIDG
jgi:hypothetical protein